MFSLFYDPMKQDSAGSLSGKYSKKIPGCKTHQMRVAVVEAGQVEEGGPGLGPLSPYAPG